MNPTHESERIRAWLETCPGTYDVRAVLVTIGRTTYPAAHYRQGPENSLSRFYVVGPLPPAYVHRKAPGGFVRFTPNGPRPFYVAAYVQNVPGGRNVSNVGALPEACRPYHYSRADGTVAPSFLLFETRAADYWRTGRQATVDVAEIPAPEAGRRSGL